MQLVPPSAVLLVVEMLGGHSRHGAPQYIFWGRVERRAVDERQDRVNLRPVEFQVAGDGGADGPRQRDAH